MAKQMTKIQRSRIIRGTIVWYWNTKAKSWKRGKVIAVNRRHLTIKERNTGRVVGDGGVFCYPASDPKPSDNPWRPFKDREAYYKNYREVSQRQSRLNWSYDNEKLLKKLGLWDKRV